MPKEGGQGRRPRRRVRLRDLFDLAYSSPWPWAAFFVVALTVLLTPFLSFRAHQYQLGHIALTTVYAPYDFSFEDEVGTAARREEAAGEVLEVYNFDDGAPLEAGERIADAFEYGRGAPEADGEVAAALRDRFGVEVREDELALLLTKEFSPELEQVLTRGVGSVLSRDIVREKDRLLALGQPIRRRAAVSKASQVRRDFGGILSLEEARELLEVQIGSLSDLRQGERSRLIELGARFLRPTLVFDFDETERRRAAARESVEPVYFQVRRGKTIVREGDEISASVLRQLDILSSENQRWGFAGALGAFLLAGVLLTIQWNLLKPTRATDAWRRQSFAMTGIVVVGHLALARLSFLVARLFSEQLVVPPFNNGSSYNYAVPFASVAVMLLLLENAPTALLASTLFSIAIGIMTGSLQLAVFSLLSSLAAILGLFQYKRRTAVVKVGLLVGAVNVAAVLAIDLLSGRHFPPSSFGFDLVCAFLGGVSVAALVSALLPVFETVFHRTTDIRLLELANGNVPILRRLALEAPGTYHHSMVVGSLAEAAAEAIGANAIFCRTAAMYHDIGKLTKINYFVENQTGGNRHDQLSPRMSALVIASHVKEGIELAEEMNLPQEIVDIIPQHHGTKIIAYFYEKAKMNQDPELREVSEDEYRYPGPKPQTREAGIIMIADAVEAASRTLDDPSPARLKGLIRQIIDYIFLDGQLNECDLTLRDLEKIAQSFQRVLMGIHHQRVSYPGFDFEKGVEPVVVQDSR
ncbi:MAG TPA: HDIG domain-containing protein [Vicinamibacteria bacterium]|nr:HDIG domain-containing protein [Vicinamibacteria bacterium]